MSERELALADIRRAIYLHEYNPEALMAQIVALAAPPVGVSPQPEGTWPADYIGRSFVDGASWWQFHHNGSTMFVSEREEAEAEAERRYGPPLSPVEPTPEPPQGVNRQWLSRIAARLAAHDRGDRSPSDDLFAWESLAYLLKYLSVEPTPDAQVCVWREREWDYESGCRGTQISRDERSSGPPDGWKHCPYCGKRLEAGTDHVLSHPPAVSGEGERLKEQAAAYRAIALDALACWQGEDDRSDDNQRRNRSARSRATLRHRICAVDDTVRASTPTPGAPR